MIMCSEEGMCKTEIGWKHSCTKLLAKWWMQIKSFWKKWKALLQWLHEFFFFFKVKQSSCWYGESFNDLDRDQNGHNISLSQSQIQSKGPNSLQFYEEREVRKLQKKSLKPVEAGLWSLRKKAISMT